MGNRFYSVSRAICRIIFAALVFLIASPSGRAQKFEAHPYAGGFFPATWADTTKLKSEGLYGARGGVFLTDRWEVEGNFGYINHFRFEDADMGTRALVWDVDAAYATPWTFKRIEPFITAGAGATRVTVRGHHDERILLLDPTFRNPDTLLEPVVLQDGQHFLTLNYGGGFKAFRLWGPMGLRADLRGRTMPDFFNHANHWFEVTAGINLAWGER